MRRCCKARNMDREQLIKEIRDNKIIVIMRGLNFEQAADTVQALYDGGIRFCEITFDAKGKTPDCDVARNIEKLVHKFDGKVNIGAGTVLTEQQVDLTAAAGGKFIISPDVNVGVIKRTRERGLVSIPGALTATEAVTAHNAGADFIKLFPVGELGPGYLKALTAPLSHIDFLAVGGITEQNIGEYLSSGACGAGIGAGIVDKRLVQEKDWAGITRLAQKYIEAANKGK